MERIIAGRFSTKADADRAARRILVYIADQDVCIFHNNPPGQHGVSVFGDDTPFHIANENNPKVSEEKAAEVSTVATAVVAGVIAGAVALTVAPLVPIVALAAAGIGSYGGSLAGALDSVDNVTPHEHHESSEPSERKGGVMLAVRIALLSTQSRVIQDLEMGGAVDIEQAEGEWNDGDWTDFNPRATPHPVQHFAEPTASTARFAPSA